MSSKNEQGGMDVTQKNVLQKPLHKHSAPKTSSSPTPALHAGFCNASNPIAATLTNGFLDLSAKTGTDLRKSGVGPGERYCIEAAQWKIAVDKGGDVPRVKLECTHVAALDKVGLDVLKRFAAGQDVDRGVEWPKDGSGTVRLSGEIGGKEPRA